MAWSGVCGSHPEHLGTKFGPMDLPRDEFFKRLHKSPAIRRAGGTGITRGRYDEWVKQALAPPAYRKQNKGMRAQYRYGPKHYRRALQLARLNARGIRDSDALIVQLFLHGYSVDPHAVREPLIKEASKALAQLHATVRSTFVSRSGEIPVASKASIVRSLGKLDPVFASAGWDIGTDGLIDSWRLTGNPHGTMSSVEAPKRLRAADEQVTIGQWQALWSMLEGIFAVDENSRWIHAEEVISQADAGELMAAKAHAHDWFFKFAAAGQISDLQDRRMVDHEVCQARWFNMAHNREWSAIALIVCLGVARFGSAIAAQMMVRRGDDDV